MPETGGVFAVWLHPGEVKASFHICYDRLRDFDFGLNRRIARFAEIHCAAGRIIDGRNDAVKMFLDTPECEWLFWVDSDMGFTPDSLELLARAADPKERPIVGGLCFGQKLVRVGDDGARDFETFPTIYRRVGEKYQPLYGYPKDTLIECDGTGSAFILIHRSVFEKIQEAEGGPYWYTQEQTSDRAAPLGEDLSFCLRAQRAGFPVHVFSAVKTSHCKDIYLNEEFYDRDRATPRRSKTFVVIPVKGQLEHTRNLLNELERQGGYDEILVFDNGSGTKMRNWLESQRIANVFDAADATIHGMWNYGVEYALRQDPAANVVILNNDLALGEDFLANLCEGLRSDQMAVAACPNYDGREMTDPVAPVFGICAGRYDGTGGFAGFAFAVRGEFFAQTGYRFPDEAKWWFGDNDLILSVYEAGGLTVMVRDATCVHLDGGSVTTKSVMDDKMAAEIEQDKAWFFSKWDAETGTRREREFVLDAPD